MPGETAFSTLAKRRELSLRLAMTTVPGLRVPVTGPDRNITQSQNYFDQRANRFFSIGARVLYIIYIHTMRKHIYVYIRREKEKERDR
jgi:hypothetical protein